MGCRRASPWETIITHHLSISFSSLCRRLLGFPLDILLVMTEFILDTPGQFPRAPDLLQEIYVLWGPPSNRAWVDWIHDTLLGLFVWRRPLSCSCSLECSCIGWLDLPGRFFLRLPWYIRRQHGSSPTSYFFLGDHFNITSLKILRSSSIGTLIYRCFSAAVLHRPTEFMGLLNVNRSMLPNMGDRKFFTLMVLVWTMKEELNALLCGISFHSLTYGSFINTAKGSDGNARF